MKISLTFGNGLVKNVLVAVALVSMGLGVTSCIGKDKEPTISEGIEDDGTGRIPTRSEIIGTWQSNEYQGWEPRLEQNVVIYRELVLNSDGTYENRYGGHLTQAKDGSSLSTTDFGDWELEKGTWTYNSSTGQISYVPNYDQRVDYDTQTMFDYDYSNYSEQFMIKTSGDYNGMWITLDQYLKRSGNKGDLRYAMKFK